MQAYYASLSQANCVDKKALYLTSHKSKLDGFRVLDSLACALPRFDF